MTQAKTKSRAFLEFSLKLLGYKKWITIINLFFNVIIFSHQAAVTYFIQQILNRFTKVSSEALVEAYPYLFGILIVAGVRIVAIMSCAILDAKRAYFYQNRIRLNATRHLMQKSDITQVTGKANQIFEVLDDDIPVATFPAELVTEASGFTIYALIAYSMLLKINWKLTVFVFVPFSIAIYGLQRLSEQMNEKRKVNREAHDAASAFIGDIADAAMSVKSAGAKEAVLHRYEQINGMRREAVMREVIFEEWVLLVLEISMIFGTGLMLYLGARLLGGDNFGIGDFSFFVAHLFTLSSCVFRIVQVITEARKGEVSYERILSTLECEPEVLTMQNELVLKKTQGEEQMLEEEDAFVIASSTNRHTVEKTRNDEKKDALLQVQDLTYTYTGNDGFRDVSFELYPGQLTVIAGGMASGKSTLLSTLLNLLPIQKGTVLSPTNLPENWIVGSPQRSGFFATDIETNLKLGQTLSDEEIARGLNIAALPSSIPLTTEIGGRGDKISGGQRQRLLMARVFARPQPIKVIDDCVSALDAETRLLVLQRIRAHLKNSGDAVVIATNTQDFMQQADQIVFMERGLVKGKGTYEELLRGYPAFAEIVS